jgi:hypothetical protein
VAFVARLVINETHRVKATAASLEKEPVANGNFVHQPGRTLANFGGIQRILESTIRIQADPGGPLKTDYLAC